MEQDFQQVSIGNEFIKHLFGATAINGLLRIHRPEGQEVFHLQSCIVTYSLASQEIVLHEGLKTTQIFPYKNWLSLQYLPPNNEDKEARMLYVKENLAYEID